MLTAIILISMKMGEMTNIEYIEEIIAVNNL